MKNRLSASELAALAWPQNAERLQEYLEPFATCFRRRDQFRWMCTYVAGLLGSDERKNAESMARSTIHQDQRESFNLAQALQNFINQSPWDEQLLWQRYRAWVKNRLAGRKSVCVISEVGFLKQGNRSIGVQRQHWQQQQKKVNCQLALMAYAVCGKEAHPLALRLYLPRTWTSDAERLKRAGVPEAQRAPASKSALALDLLQRLETEGWSFDSAVCAGRWAGSEEFRQQVSTKPYATLLEVGADQVHFPWAEPPPGSESVQLSSPEPARYFWVPWSRGDREDECAHRLLVEESSPASRNLIFSRVSKEQTLRQTAQLWQTRQEAIASEQRMKRQLGLDHFEGRSWRGFHHHLCLVALAHGFLGDVPTTPASARA